MAAVAAQAPGEPPAGEVSVGFLGHAARVPLRRDEGLRELQSRVAASFGLGSPGSFDLMGPEGRPLRSDEDVLRVAGAVDADVEGLSTAPAAAMQVTVDAREEALLDLERAHERSAELRWGLVRKVVAGLRTQVAEALAAIGEAGRRTAVLEERLLHERSAREASENTLQRDLRSIAERFASETERGQAKAQAVLQETVAGVERRFGESLAARCTALGEDLETLRSSLRDAEEARARQSDDALKRLEDMRSDLSREAESRSAALDVALANLDARLTAEQEARLALETRADRELAGIGETLRTSTAEQGSNLAEIRSALEEVKASMGAEAAARGESARDFQRRLEDITQAGQADLDRYKKNYEERLGSLATANNFRELADALHQLSETQAREKADAQGTMQTLREDLERKFSELQAGEERVQKSLADISEATTKLEAGAQEASAGHAAALGELNRRLENAEGLAKQGEAVAAANKAEFMEAVAAERKQREDQAAVEATRGEALLGELQRSRDAQAKDLEQLSATLREERGSALAELRTHCEGLSSATSAECAQVRAELHTEAKRLDAACAELRASQVAQDVVISETSAQYKREASATAEDIKAALDAHGELTEALEKEQRSLGEDLRKSLAKEGERRGCLSERLEGLETDMQRVRGHLPIIFFR